MVGHKQVASKSCKIEVHDFPHASESISTVTFSLNGSPIDYPSKHCESIFFRNTLKNSSEL